MSRCPACFLEKGHAAACDHCGWRPGSAPENPLYLAPGTDLGENYRIGRVLGHGGLGVTYLAWDNQLATRVAIKEFLPENMAGRHPETGALTVHTGQDENFRHALDRFLEEARILARFDQHPGIVSVKRFFRANATGYMVMEFVAGQTLRQYLAAHGGSLPWRQAWTLLAPVMDTLGQLHKADLLHRDIAPDNIYLTHDNRIKLIDFGAAREVTRGRSAALSIILKPGYAPAEQYREKGQQGPWTDVYALSATLYRAITGQLPPAALDRLYRDELPSPAALGVTIPEEYEGVLMKGLAIHPEGRWRSIGEMQAAWQEADRPGPAAGEGSGAGEAGSPPLPPVAPDDRNERNKRNERYIKIGLWIGFLTLLITALGVGITVLMFMDERPPETPDLVVEDESPVLLADNAPVWRGSAALQGGPSDAGSAALQGGSSDAGSAALQGGSSDAGSAALQGGNSDNGLVGAERGLPPATPLEPPLPRGVEPERRQDTAAPREESPPKEEPIPPPPARLTVRSNVTGDTAFIDGEPVGPTGPGPHELTAGEYTVRVEKEGYEAFETKVTLKPGGEETIEARLEPATAQLVVAANVPEAIVFVDGEWSGLSGATPYPVLPGERTVRVEKEGYEPFETRITLKPGAEETVRARLVVKVPAPGRTFRDPLKDGSPGPEMMALPAGEFSMGSPKDEKGRYNDEGPQRRVSIAGFALGVTEVTFAEYERFVLATRGATGRKLPEDRGWGRGQRPVINVSWKDATGYAEWLSRETGQDYRLPTEAEWEYAARAGTTTPFSTGECIHTDQANYHGDRFDYAGCGANTRVVRGKTVPAGSLPANPWGLHEMHGNVWEWTCSLRKVPYDGSEQRCAAKGVGGARVSRGGSWASFPRWLRSACRGGGNPDDAGSFAGFRLARGF